MVKTKLETEQLIAEAFLLGFDKVSSLDIDILREMFLSKYPNYEFMVDKEEYLLKYIAVEDSCIVLKEGLTLDSYIEENNSNLEKRLRQIAGRAIREGFKDFDEEEFILRKIQHSSTVFTDYIPFMFSLSQQQKIKELEGKGYLITTWQDEIPYEDYREIGVSQKGNVLIFKSNHKSEIERFVNELKSLRCDTSLLDDYLLTVDLTDQIWSILDVKKLEEFCKTYDRALPEPGAQGVYFKRLGNKKGSIFDEEGTKQIQNMLSVWDEGHCIFVCHPNHLFAGEKLQTADVREIKHINWNDIDINKMRTVNDYGTFVYPDCRTAFRYVHNRLGHHVRKAMERGTSSFATYLVVVEKYTFDNEDNYLVRGIIKGDMQGYSIAFNPEYQGVIPQSSIDANLRFSGKEVPYVYCKKRNNNNV